ncbi:hypothetical protein ACWF9B_00595 [Streptomyces sp. NPDC055089]
MLELFWEVIAEQLEELRSAKNAADVLRVLASGNNPTRGFFAGSGGDDTVEDALHTAGWMVVWAESSLYYTMRAPDGSLITYVEGDILTGDRHGNNPAQTAQLTN